ncbi:MAG TPA: amidase [Dehalococcoidia bacterium]|nr:amidase [Dehalococcoidia bacterium]
MTTGTDLCYLTATELAPLIRERKVSPVEVVEARLTRIEEHNPLLLAYLHVDAEGARAAARAAEIEIGAGIYRGPLHGIPVAYKDIYDVRGLPTTAASKVMAGYVATKDSTAAARLRQAGAICLGKLNTFEFASGSMETFGTARNPWNPGLTPGGSSSGSGAALAAGLVTIATGSDTGGSIRMPASFCGVVGIKPTYGRVSRAGIVPLSWSLDHAGPMARRTADLAPALTALAGPDHRDPTAAARPVPDLASEIGRPIRGLRIGVPRAFFFEDADPEVIRTVEESLSLFARDLGAEIREIELPHAGFGPSASWSIAYSESFAYHRDNFFARPRDYTPPFLHKITAAACLTAEERVTAQRVRQVISAEFLAALEQVDVIVTPTTGYPAHAVNGASRQTDMHSLTRPISLTGLPALALPCGFTATGGLPASLQIIAPAWQEGLLLRIGHAYEEAAGWHHRRPTLEATPLPTAPASSRPSDSSPTEPAIDPAWVIAFARLTGLTYVTEADAKPIATHLAPVKAQLAAARARLDNRVEPSTRPVLG